MRGVMGLVLMCGLLAPCRAAEPWACDLRFTQGVRATPFTGRVVLFFSKGSGEPRLGPNWFQPEPMASVDVVHWAPETTLRIDPSTPGLRTLPRGLTTWPESTRRVQAVARFDDWSREVGRGPGNGYSSVVELPTDDPAGPMTLVIDRVVEAPVFRETEWSRLCGVPSPVLTKFHGRPVSVNAGVILPASYHREPDRRYPVIFTIPGFGGTHHAASRDQPIAEENPDGIEFLRVILDPSCPWGHHVFADSANNGPWGTALVTEWLPEFSRRFRVAERGRFLTGHSSGGWSSLWLQVTYPDIFDGVWSTAPDSVDFRDFQQANIYRVDEHAWTNPQGERRPIARRGGQPVLWWDDFDWMEQVVGRGGQFESFEAVFGPREESGQPRRLWDRATGRIDPVTAEAWRAYDIRQRLHDEWPTLGPKLAGKLHLFMGEQDTFYLTGAAELLKEELMALGSDAVIEIHPGKDHGSLLTPELTERIRGEMRARWKIALSSGHPADGH